MRLYCSINLNPDRDGINVSCCECGRSLPLYHTSNGFNDTMICDGDGKPFQAYYCWRCAQELAKMNEPQYYPGQYALQERVDRWLNDPNEQNWRDMRDRTFDACIERSANTGERHYVVAHPWTRALSYCTLAALTAPKDWQTNPEGFPSMKHVIDANS